MLGAVTALVGAVMCFEQRHLKRLLAFSTVSHVGLFLAGIALLTPIGLAGAALYIAAHGLAKGALFMAVGVLLHRFAEVDALALRGRGRGGGLRLCGVVFAVGALVIAGTPMLGCFVGKSLIEAASVEQGYAWLPALFTIASALTGGAILRVTGTVFAGWGPDAPRVGEQPQQHDEQFETLQPHDRTPAVMLAPAVVLMAGAIVVGLVGGLVHGAERAAALFVDRAAYAATVLSGARAPLPRVEPTALTATDFLYGTASVLGAIAIAALALFGGALLGRVPAAVARPAGAALEALRSVHSGHVGDYVAWITAGLAALGAAFTLALR